MFVIRLMSVSLVLHQVMSSGSGRHSLWGFATFSLGTTSVPEFSGALMLDDIQVVYYDTKIDRLIGLQGGKQEEVWQYLGQDAMFILHDVCYGMKDRMMQVKQQYNLTLAGVLIYQRLAGCEILESGEAAVSLFMDGINGQDADSMMYNMTHFTYATSAGWKLHIGTIKQTQLQMLFSNIYMPACVRVLRHLLNREKRLVLRRVRPRVHVMKKQVVGGARLTCLATDFYPRHINLTLLRDGRPVDDGELTGGSVLPNGNGLYQVRKTLTVDEEELQRKHDYTCAASHLSLDNRLEVNWRAESSHSHRVYHFLSVPTVLLLFGVLMLVLWRRRRHREKSEEVSDH